MELTRYWLFLSKKCWINVVSSSSVSKNIGICQRARPEVLAMASYWVGLGGLAVASCWVDPGGFGSGKLLVSQEKKHKHKRFSHENQENQKNQENQRKPRKSKETR